MGDLYISYRMIFTKGTNEIIHTRMKSVLTRTRLYYLNEKRFLRTTLMIQKSPSHTLFLPNIEWETIGFVTTTYPPTPLRRVSKPFTKIPSLGIWFLSSLSTSCLYVTPCPQKLRTPFDHHIVFFLATKYKKWTPAFIFLGFFLETK